MRWEIANGYIVSTHDLDFGTMLSLSDADRPSVLQVRCLNVLPEAIATLVLSVDLRRRDRARGAGGRR
jgi:predicted nuclease of predicted toxin-antitoxin system